MSGHPPYRLTCQSTPHTSLLPYCAPVPLCSQVSPRQASIRDLFCRCGEEQEGINPPVADIFCRFLNCLLFSFLFFLFFNYLVLFLCYGFYLFLFIYYFCIYFFLLFTFTYALFSRGCRTPLSSAPSPGSRPWSAHDSPAPLATPPSRLPPL